jgi:acetyl-CoA carboxylase carboxyltransferase component
MENRLPIIYLVDSAGVYITATGKSSQTKNILEDFLEIMQMSSMGITNFSNNGKLCCRRSLPTYMSDEAIIVEGTGSIPCR